MKNQNILLAHALGKSEIWLERQAKEKWNYQRSIKQLWDFPGGPPAVAHSALPFHGGLGSIPDQETGSYMPQLRPSTERNKYFKNLTSYNDYYH